MPRPTSPTSLLWAHQLRREFEHLTSRLNTLVDQTSHCTARLSSTEKQSTDISSLFLQLDKLVSGLLPSLVRRVEELEKQNNHLSHLICGADKSHGEARERFLALEKNESDRDSELKAMAESNEELERQVAGLVAGLETFEREQAINETFASRLRVLEDEGVGLRSHLQAGQPKGTAIDIDSSEGSNALVHEQHPRWRSTDEPFSTTATERKGKQTAAAKGAMKRKRVSSVERSSASPPPSSSRLLVSTSPVPVNCPPNPSRALRDTTMRSLRPRAPPKQSYLSKSKSHASSKAKAKAGSTNPEKNLSSPLDGRAPARAREIRGKRPAKVPRTQEGRVSAEEGETLATVVGKKAAERKKKGVQRSAEYTITATNSRKEKGGEEIVEEAGEEDGQRTRNGNAGDGNQRPNAVVTVAVSESPLASASASRSHRRLLSAARKPISSFSTASSLRPSPIRAPTLVGGPGKAMNPRQEKQTRDHQVQAEIETQSQTQSPTQVQVQPPLSPMTPAMASAMAKAIPPSFQPPLRPQLRGQMQVQNRARAVARDGDDSKKTKGGEDTPPPSSQQPPRRASSTVSPPQSEPKTQASTSAPTRTRGQIEIPRSSSASTSSTQAPPSSQAPRPPRAAFSSASFHLPQHQHHHLYPDDKQKDGREGNPQAKAKAKTKAKGEGAQKQQQQQKQKQRQRQKRFILSIEELTSLGVVAKGLKLV
ncbi:MAG: hypothetical protein M1819_002534 [Sarea resinae]|nr:MAG: hypothetical protein M1819_002534 [Sarea resinae]